MYFDLILCRLQLCQWLKSAVSMAQISVLEYFDQILCKGNKDINCMKTVQISMPFSYDQLEFKSTSSLCALSSWFCTWLFRSLACHFNF